MIILALFFAFIILAFLAFSFLGALFPNPQADLFQAIEDRDVAAIQRAIDDGADPNKPAPSSFRNLGKPKSEQPTPLGDAVDTGNEEVIDTVTKPERCSWFGLSCETIPVRIPPRVIDRARTPKDVTRLGDQRLRQHGHDPSTDPGPPFPSELLFASQRLCLGHVLHRPAMVQALLAAGADPNADCEDPHLVLTPVHQCAKLCAVVNRRTEPPRVSRRVVQTGELVDRTQSLRFLVAAGGDLKRRSGVRSDPDHRSVWSTPLLDAVKSGPANAAMLRRVRVLLELGAPVGATTHEGLDAFALVRARRKGDRHDDIIAALREPPRPAVPKATATKDGVE